MADISWLANRLRNDRFLAPKVREEGNWQGRGRPGAFNPVGVLLHHTAAFASPSNPAPSLNTVINGRGGDDPLPGPLCHILIDRNGLCRIIADGRANHAGTAQADGAVRAGDGNELYVGIEIEYNGTTQSPAPEQIVSAIDATAAIISRLGRNAQSVSYHKRTSVTGKIDPANIRSVAEFRSNVAAVIDNRW